MEPKGNDMILAFDFDGVLVDTMKECHASYNAALSDEKLPGLSLDEFALERKTAVQATDFFTQYLLRKEKKQYTEENLSNVYEKQKSLVLKLRKNYHEKRDGLLSLMFDQNPLYPGVIQTLENLHAAGIQMAVISARDDSSLKKYLENKKLGKYFEKVVGSSFFFAKSRELKPLQLESLEGEEIYFVDDMPSVLFSLEGKVKRRFFAAWGYGALPSDAEDIVVLKKPSDVCKYVLPERKPSGRNVE